MIRIDRDFFYRFMLLFLVILLVMNLLFLFLKHAVNWLPFEISFLDYAQNPIQFSCLFGPNGCGKTTVLESIVSIFSNYDNYDRVRLQALLGKLVRHIEESSLAHVSTESLDKSSKDLASHPNHFSL